MAKLPGTTDPAQRPDPPIQGYRIDTSPQYRPDTLDATEPLQGIPDRFACDRGDLVAPDGKLTHGGRAYRRELVARIIAEWARKSGGFNRADARAAVLSANRIIEALVADLPNFA